MSDDVITTKLHSHHVRDAFPGRLFRLLSESHDHTQRGRARTQKTRQRTWTDSE